MHETRQMETDTTTEEREVLLQRAIEATNLGHRHDIEVAIRQIKEHIHLYGGDEGIAALQETLKNLEALIADETPESVRYQESAGQ
ncbi:MAG: hypothetical protein H7Z41_18430 [Cytophagales bacterium]|nr:hypothetical protein [Armatimonadota bacterium]